jgi:hypothetical protein
MELLKRIAACWEPVYVNTVFYRVNIVFNCISVRVVVCHVSFPPTIV